MEKHANEPRVHRTSSVLWLAQSDLSYESECVGCKWSLCADGVYSFSAFVMVLHEEQISLPSPSSVRKPVLGLLQNSVGLTLFILYT